MALLLVMCGGMAAFGLVGCTDGIARLFRQIPPGDAGSDAGQTIVDAGSDAQEAHPDTVPITCPTKLVGYATMDGGTTGGGDAAVYTATSLAQLRTYAGMVGPAVVRIGGTIAFGPDVSQVEIESDKTILPVAPGDGLTGNGLIIKDKHNVIVRNLTVTKALKPYDAITIQKSNNVWVDHCNLSSELVRDTYDGLIDITHGSSNVTVSWTIFHDHYNTSLVGHTDTVNTEDLTLSATFHHNRFLRTPSGSPRARFGHVHVFSNHYGEGVDTYAIASAMGANVLVQSNVFDEVNIPIATHWEDNGDGNVTDLTNLYNPSSSAANNIITTPPSTWAPPYAYQDSVDSTLSLPIIIEACAGADKVP